MRKEEHKKISLCQNDKCKTKPYSYGKNKQDSDFPNHGQCFSDWDEKENPTILLAFTTNVSF